MNFSAQWMQSDWLQTLGWTFVHSLWQIAVTGLLLYVVLRLIPGRSAHVRYTISTMAIWLIVIMALSTFIIMLPGAKQITEVTGNVLLMKSTSSETLVDQLTIWLESNMPMMLTIWLGGVLILMIRLLFSLGWVSHIRSTALLSPDIQGTLDDIIHRLHLKINPVATESGHVSSPVTIGHLKPLILFPIGIINQLTPGEVEAILTHELAHIVRRDYLSNLIQSFIETLFYYHPVTWWISGVVRSERENRADDLAISWCGDHLGYAKALLTVQEMQVAHGPSLAIGFTSRKGAMLARIQRILHIPYKNHNQMEKTVLLSLCSLCFLAFTVTGNTNKENQDMTGSSFKDLISLIEPTTDTIPTEGTYRIHKKTENQEINIEVENGEIKELEIDGKEIAPSSFDEYEGIIDELFGAMEAPPSMEGFNFEMPAMPPMPGMPAMPAMPPMHSMPSMNSMAPMMEMELKYLIDNGKIVTGEGFNYKFLNDSMGDFHSKIIIIDDNGDSSVIITPGSQWQSYMPALALEEFMLDAEEWKKQGEQWKEMSEEWKQEWNENSEQWQEELRAHQEELKENSEQLYREGQKLRGEGMIDHYRMKEDQLQAIQEALRVQEMEIGSIHNFMAPRMNMTDAMVEEGLIESGEEVLIQLTPDRLKINGKKMDADTHRRYLKMYENQQGVQLSGNSRVEFRTQSRRSM